MTPDDLSHIDDYMEAFVAIAPCGCVAAVRINEPAYRDDVLDWALTRSREGYKIEPTTLADAKARIGCDHTPLWGRS